MLKTAIVMDKVVWLNHRHVMKGEFIKFRHTLVTKVKKKHKLIMPLDYKLKQENATRKNMESKTGGKT